MTHNQMFHNADVGGVWALHQITSNSFPTTGTVANDVRTALGFDGVVGFCLRFPWNFVESNTVQGQYTHTILNNALSICREFDKKFSIRPISGRYTPSYIYNSLGARGYAVNGGTAPHPCNTNGTPNTIWLTRFFAFMQDLVDWALDQDGDVPYVHGTHFSNQYSEFYHGPEVRSPTTGYDSGNNNFNAAHEALWEGVWDIVDGTGLATEFGMSGTHVEDIQINAVEHLHSLAGDWSPYLFINANGTAGAQTGGTDWGATTEAQQDANCGFAQNGVFNPPAARRVTRMNQMIQPGNYSATYWHNTFQTVRVNRSEGVEIYLADGTAIGAPGKSFSGAGAVALQDEINTWTAEIVGSPPTQSSGPVAQTLPRLTQSAAAHRWVVMSSAQTLPHLTQVATLIKEPDPASGIAAQGLPALTQAATATRTDDWAAAQTLPSLIQAVTADQSNATGEGVVGQAFPSLIQTATMLTDSPNDQAAIVVSLLPALTQEVEGTDTGTEFAAAQTLPSMNQVVAVRNNTQRYIHPVGAVKIVDGAGLILTEPPLPRPDYISIGLFDRQSMPSDGGQGGAWGNLVVPVNYVKGFVCNVNWDELQPDGPDDVFPASSTLTDAITQADSEGMQLKVRVFFGQYAPDWAKSLDGPAITMFVPDDEEGVSGEPFTVGSWWTDAYIEAITNFWQQFADTYNGYVYPSGPLREVTISSMMTRFAEPMIRQNKEETNRTALSNAGYTLDLDLAAQAADIEAHAPLRCISSLACNPYQVGTTKQNLSTHTLNLMDYARETLGRFASVGSNNIRIESGWPSTKLGQVYLKIDELGQPSYFQTAAPARVGNLYETCVAALDYGATMIELPGTTSQYTNDGVLGMTPDQFDEINEGCATNAALQGWS